MINDWVHGVGHSSVCQILLQIVVRAVITSSQPAWTSSAGMLPTPADFPFFNDYTAASTSLQSRFSLRPATMVRMPAWGWTEAFIPRRLPRAAPIDQAPVARLENPRVWTMASRFPIDWFRVVGYFVMQYASTSVGPVNPVGGRPDRRL